MALHLYLFTPIFALKDRFSKSYPSAASACGFTQEEIDAAEPVVVEDLDANE